MYDTCAHWVVFFISFSDSVHDMQICLNLKCLCVTLVPTGLFFFFVLQILEILNMIYVVGMTVSPFIILSREYCNSEDEHRLRRLRDALGKVGGCIVFGCGVSIITAAFVQFGISQFFYKFGVFMFMSMLFSVIYCLMFFGTFLGLIGPNGNCCSLACLCPKKKTA